MAMTDDAESKQQVLARLARSRAEIKRVLEPAPRVRAQPSIGPLSGSGISASSGGFPRSRTMRLLMSGRGVGTAGAVVGGLLMARPSLVFKVLKMLPTGAVARMLMVKAISAYRSRP